MPCTDPHWTAYLSAWGTPIIALIAGGWGGYIAWRQWHTAQNRLRLDLFDKRFAAYAAARDVPYLIRGSRRIGSISKTGRCARPGASITVVPRSAVERESYRDDRF
jgi:hypothetical protein